jgi:hypothetical protein
MGQPEERFLVELLRPLAGQTQELADGGEGLGWVTLQAIARHQDKGQTLWQARQSVPQALLDEDTL